MSCSKSSPCGSKSVGNIYGSFYDLTDQTGNANTILTMILGKTDTTCTKGISIKTGTTGNLTRITVSKSGIYDIQFSAQFVRNAGNNATHIHIWLSKNGVDVPDSATRMNFPNQNSYQVGAWNFFFKAKAGDYVELKWYIDSNVNNAVVMKHENATTVPVITPAIPSLIVTVNEVG